MLATLQSVLKKAQRQRYAVGAFNVSDLEQTQAVIRAAVKQRSPVIVNTSEKAIAYAGLEELALLVQTMAKKVTVPVVLNLDHGHALPLAKDCLAAGYSGLMFDGSRFSLAKNISQTKQLVTAARRRGVGVEGELGYVKYPSELKKDPRLILTDPAEAQDFVRRTGVAAFAVAIGNAHGLPMAHEKLEFGVLKQIRDRVSVPLVLHGASGTPAAKIRRAISLGITKINIDTDLRLAFSSSVRKSLKQSAMFDPREYLTAAREAVQATVEEKMIQFGSRNKSR